MWYANHVVYFSPELESLQIVDGRRPKGLTVTPQGDMLVGAWDPHSVCHLRGKVGSVCNDIIMEFTDEEIHEYGTVSSVAMKGNQLVVLFSSVMHRYEWL